MATASPRSSAFTSQFSPRHHELPNGTDAGAAAEAAACASSSAATRSQGATVAVLKSQLRLEQHRTAELKDRLQQLQLTVRQSDSAATEEALHDCELQLRNERKRRSAAETAAKLAKSEAFKVKKALAETREDAQERVNGAERRYGETTRRTNQLETSNKALRKQVRELEAEVQAQFEESVAQRRSQEQELQAARAEADALRQQVGQLKKQLSEAIQGNKGTVGKERAAKQRLKGALSKARLEAEQAKAAVAEAHARVKELTLSKSALQKQVKALQKRASEAEARGGMSQEAVDALLAGGSSAVSTQSNSESFSTRNGSVPNTPGGSSKRPPTTPYQKAIADSNERAEKLALLARQEQEISQRLRDDLKRAMGELELAENARKALEIRLAEETASNDRLRKDFKQRIANLDRELTLRGEGVAELEERAQQQQQRQERAAAEKASLEKEIETQTRLRENVEAQIRLAKEELDDIREALRARNITPEFLLQVYRKAKREAAAALAGRGSGQQGTPVANQENAAPTTTGSGGIRAADKGASRHGGNRRPGNSTGKRDSRNTGTDRKRRSRTSRHATSKVPPES